MRLAHAKRRDKNEREIIDALRAVGAKVLQMDTVDLLVYYKKQLHLLEVKSAKGKLNAEQEKLAETWPIHVVRCTGSALLAIGAITA